MRRLKVLLAVISLLIISHAGYSQMDQIGNVLKAGIGDAEKITHAYLKPYGEMLGVNLNAGWYNSAKVHKLGGFDVTVSASFTQVPSGGKSFNVEALNLQNFDIVGDNNMSPTLAGGKNSTPVSLAPKVVGGEYASFELPKGSGYDAFISPMIQAAVGLPFHTEVMGRFMPEMKYGDIGKASLWGIGLKHSLKDYIPFVKRVPVLNVSLLAAYTHFSSDVGLSSLDLGNFNQEMTANSNAFTSRLLVGANLPVVAFYAGLGYGRANTNFAMEGTFANIPGIEGEIKDPLSLDYETDGFDFNIGMRIRLAVFSIHADYSVGEYSVITAGVGINFR